MAESKGGVKFARDDFQIDNANFMKKLWVKQDFTDVTLVADDGLVRSHKVVLAAGSSVFQDLHQNFIIVRRFCSATWRSTRVAAPAWHGVACSVGAQSA